MAPTKQRASRSVSSTIQSTSVSQSLPVPEQNNRGEKRPLEDEESSQLGNKQMKIDDSLLETNRIESALKRLEDISDKVNQLSERGDNFDHFGRYIASLLRCLPTQRAVELQQEVIDLVMRSHVNAPDPAQ